VIAALVAAGIGLIGATASLTLGRYGELPDRVPMHFWFDGTVVVLTIGFAAVRFYP
jgi:hypothetical protein